MLRLLAMAEIPESVRTFLREYIDSVDQLEILLLLRRTRERRWTAAEVSRTLSTHHDSAAARLAEFSARGILSAEHSSAATCYQYGPRLPHLDSAIEEVAKAYSTFPTHLIDLIFSKPIDKIRTFSEAGRKKEDQ